MNDVAEMKTVKMFNLLGQLVEFKVQKERDEKHFHDSVRCMRAKGLKCKCHYCKSALHGIIWKRQLEKMDKFLHEQNESSQGSRNALVGIFNV